MTRQRPYSERMKPGRIDVEGSEWWACDPYPTWYRWQGGELIVRRDNWSGNPLVWQRPADWNDPAPWLDEVLAVHQMRRALEDEEVQYAVRHLALDHFGGDLDRLRAFLEAFIREEERDG